MLTHAPKNNYTNVPMRVISDKNFGLTATEFADLLQRLREKGDETLVKTIFETQYRDCRDLLMRKYNASADNAHDVVMQVLLQFRSDLIAGKLDYNNLVSLFKTQSWQNYVKAQGKAQKIVFSDPTLPTAYDLDLKETEDNIVQTIENEEVMMAFRKAFARLCERCKTLMNRHYSEELQWKQIGEIDNKSAGAIRVEALECRKKLKGYFQAAL
jgi:RNA polymerase sigma factor (sigma-70 family)